MNIRRSHVDVRECGAARSSEILRSLSVEGSASPFVVLSVFRLRRNFYTVIIAIRGENARSSTHLSLLQAKARGAFDGGG